MQGRKKIEINQDSFEKLLRIHCTQEEIAGFLDVSINTLKSWVRRTYGKSFTEVADIYRAAGRASLRRLLYKHAGKSAAVCIFLAKNELGMSDAPNDGKALDADNKRESNIALSKAIEQASATFSQDDDQAMADIPIPDDEGE